MFTEEPGSRVRIPSTGGSIFDMIRSLECGVINPAFAPEVVSKLTATTSHTIACVVSTPEKVPIEQIFAEVQKTAKLGRGTFLDLLRYVILRPEAITEIPLIAGATTVESEGEEKYPCIYKDDGEICLNLCDPVPDGHRNLRFLVAA